jgi:hypothetical protein
MKFFIRNMFLFGATCFLITGVMVFAERLLLNRQGHFVLPRGKKYIFLGHSHAQTAYNDMFIDSALNLASAGEAYFYTYIKLKKITENNKEKKIVFIEYSNNNILTEMDNWIWDDIHINYRYRLYSPYTDLSEMKVLYTKNPKVALICDIKSIVNNIYYIFNLKNIAVDQKMGGYIDLVRDKTDSLLHALSKNHKELLNDTNVSVTNIIYLKKMIDVCRQKGYSVYLIRTPLHPSYSGLANEEVFKKILSRDLGNVDFLDFKDYPLSNSDFGDLQHINFRGAKKYSIFFNKLLKQGLLSSNNKQEFINEQMAMEKARN